MITFGSLFSGIGGFDLGFERAGMACAWQVEINGQCQKVLARHWPNVDRYKDVRNVGRKNLSAVDLICGGSPCQDVSIAGRRAGLAGERSGLWFEFHRILTELNPEWCIIENVPGLLSSNGGRDFAVILRGLVEIGYRVAWRVLDAQHFGVAQRRRRLFVVGHLGDGRAAEVLFEREGLSGDFEESRQTERDVAGTLAAGAHPGSYNGQDAYTGNLIANALSTNPANRLSGEDNYVVGTLSASGAGTARTGNGNETDMLIAFQSTGSGQDATENLSPPRRVGGNHAPVAVAIRGRENGGVAELGGDVANSLQCAGGGSSKSFCLTDGVRRLTPVECERLQGFPDDWTAGHSDTARYRMLGNAVCVPVAEWIGRRIVEIDKEIAR